MLDLIKSRKSVRKYSEKHISDEDLRKILEAGRLAPSWMNVQSWKFILIKSEENKELLSKLSLGQAHVKNADALSSVSQMLMRGKKQKSPILKIRG